jgi:hypothetical protein
MRIFSLKFKTGFQVGLIAAITIAVGIGFVDYSVSQSCPITSNPNPTITPSAELKPTQEQVLPLSLNATFIPADSTDLVWEMIGKVNIDRALIDLKKITGEEPLCIDDDCHTINNRTTGSEELSWAKDYFHHEFDRLGYATELQGWSRSGYTDQNLIAKRLGVVYPEEEIYLVAHLDGVGGSPAADDNASGAVDLLELARVLSDYSFSRTVVLLISTGEEQGTLGVQSYLGQLSQSELSAIKNVVNIDMIGYDANQDQVMELWHGGHSPSLVLTQTMSDTIKAYEIGLSPKFVIGCG